MTRGNPPIGPGRPPRRGGRSDREDGHPGPAVVVEEAVRPPPDIQVTGNRLFVTLDLAGMPPGPAAHYLGTNILIVWCRDDPAETSRLVRLPVDVEPSEAIVRITNNILDVAAPVRRPRAPEPPAPPPEDPA